MGQTKLSDEERKTRANAAWRKWYASHKEQQKERNRKYAQENPEVIRRKRERDKPNALRRATKWYSANRDEAIKKAGEWRKRNIEAARSNWMKWYARNADRLRARCRSWYRANRTRHMEYNAIYKRNHPVYGRVANHKRKARLQGAAGSFTTSEWIGLCNKYGNKCLSCQRQDVKLTADHVVPISRGGSNDISNIQPLCQSCNSTKGTRVLDYR